MLPLQKNSSNDLERREVHSPNEALLTKESPLIFPSHVTFVASTTRFGLWIVEVKVKEREVCRMSVCEMRSKCRCLVEGIQEKKNTETGKELKQCVGKVGTLVKDYR